MERKIFNNFQEFEDAILELEGDNPSPIQNRQLMVESEFQETFYN